MKYGLALGGGAARGLAHIGVLKYLEEKNIEIGEISGTSMGSIIGVLYASGKTIDEIKQIAKDLKLYKLLDFDVKTGLLKGKKAENFLKETLGDVQFEDLDIPVKIVATCLETGKQHVFEKGNVIQAIRASMSLPGVLAPLELDKKHYVDGGITCNLPVEVLDNENIIAISALKDLSGKFKKTTQFLGIDFRKSFFAVNYDVIHRTITIMMDQNETRSKNTSGKKVIYMRPDFGDLDYYSFDKVGEIIELGYSEAVKQLSF